MVKSLQEGVRAVSAGMLVFLLIGSILPLVWAQDDDSEQITVSVDRNVVTSGEKISIAGRVPGLGANEKPLIRVFDPNGDLVRVDPLDVDPDGNYSYELVLGGIANMVGDYKIVVSHGSREAESSVRFDTSLPPTCTNYFVPGGLLPRWQLTTENGTYGIEYLIINATLVEMDANVGRKSIIVKIDAASDGCFIILLPTEVLDAENRNFTTYLDNQLADSRELEDNRNNTRSLFIPFGAGDAQIEIIGTRIVPEFSSFVLPLVVAGVLFPVFLLPSTIFRSLYRG